MSTVAEVQADITTLQSQLTALSTEVSTLVVVGGSTLVSAVASVQKAAAVIVTQCNQLAVDAAALPGPTDAGALSDPTSVGPTNVPKPTGD